MIAPWTKPYSTPKPVEPWKLQSFGAGEGALASLFQATSGQKPFESRDPVRSGRSFDLRKSSQGAGAAWNSVWEGLSGADAYTRGQVNSIFASLGQGTLDLLARKGIGGHAGRLESASKGFSDRFLGGINAFLSEKGDWEWDFETKDWKKTAQRLGKENKERVAGVAAKLPGLKHTQGKSWADINVTSTKY